MEARTAGWSCTDSLLAGGQLGALAFALTGLRMKTLHLYLLRQVVATVLMTVTVFTFVLLLGNVMKEILALLMNRQVTFGIVVQAIALLIPFVMVFALPMGLLTATLLVFGRFSADQELTAVRAGGVSLIALITPVLLLSVVLSGLAGWFNLQFAPQCRVAYKELLLRLGVQQATGFLAENQFIRDFPGYVIYVGKVEGENLRNLIIYEMSTNAPAAMEGSVPTADVQPSAPGVERILSAPSARLTVSTNFGIALHLPEVEAVQVDSWVPGIFYDFTLELDRRPRPASKLRVPLTDKTFQDLLEEYYDYQREGVTALPVAVQMHRQVAFSFACISFTLVGIPLGIRAHRRETSAGIAIALLLVLVYYSFIVLAQAWETHPRRHPELIMWVPNFTFQALGCWLLWRANRRG